MQKKVEQEVREKLGDKYFIKHCLEGKELNRGFHYPGIERIEYYKEALKILKLIDPALDFYYEIPENMITN